MCKRAVHEGARHSPSLWCAVADTPQSTQAVSCGTRQGFTRDRGPEWCFFSWRCEESERSGITLPDARGWSTQVAAGSGDTLSLREEGRRREAFAQSGAA